MDGVDTLLEGHLSCGFGGFASSRGYFDVWNVDVQVEVRNPKAASVVARNISALMISFTRPRSGTAIEHVEKAERSYIWDFSALGDVL